ncbi:hypothetical protein [Actinacidiphila glaucinigra]|uniref:hypothetical protein n=1 Tax=Actinacidiphila glaucinigra TaxID=235986 RepID=UPI0029B3D0D2|nr:hypothetical protein [Actinacidiphila glaucinigra]MDX3235671.1 hypothetical protein [Streptomyces sp. ME03-5709C]
MSDLSKASQDAVDAARQGERYAEILAVIAAVQATQQQVACHHQAPAPRQSGQAAKWVGIGVGASIFLLAVALSAVAVAISAVALTICVLVLRGIWQDVQKKGGK